MGEPYDRAEYPITPHDVWQVIRYTVEAISFYAKDATDDAMTDIAAMTQFDWDVLAMHIDCKRQLARIARARAREAGGDE